MRLGANHLVRAIVGLVVCAGAIILVLSNRSDRTLWADRLSGWPSAQGKVIRIEQYTISDSDGNKQEHQRAIVRFSAADGKPGEGMLFDEGRQAGESVKVFYDPAVDYSPNSLYKLGREIYTEEFLADRAKQDPWAGVGIIAVALLALGYSGFEFYRHSKARMVGDIFEPTTPTTPTARAIPVVPSKTASGKLVPMIKPKIPAAPVAHDGTPLDPGLEFFCPPPAAIGAVLSAYSTLHKAKRATSARIRAVAIGACVIVPGIAVACVFAWSHSIELTEVVVMLSALVFGFGTALAIVLTRFAHVVTYVGTAGASRHVLKGSRSRSPEDEIYLFEHAAVLWATIVARHYKTIYLNTDYDFKWNDAAGHRMFRVRGWFHSKSQRPKTSNAFHFARAVEASWSTHLFNRLAPSLRTAGCLEFKLGGYDRVRVGPGFLEFCGSGEVERCQADDIKSFKLHNGRFTAVTRHASAFSGQGKYSLDCQKCPNAATFLLAVRTLVGWKE